MEFSATTVVLVEESGCRWLIGVDPDWALTLVALVSEDPKHWDDMASCWDRYRSPVVPEFANSLTWAAVDLAVVLETLEQQEAWIVIDLLHKRILTGGNAPTIERNAGFAMEVDERDDEHWSMNIHLPPWWELEAQTTVDQVRAPRQTPAVVRRTDRDLLYGSAMLNDLATRILAVVASPGWQSIKGTDNARRQQAVTIEVHRDWLMTPRDDLNGGTPRQLLHGGIDWINKICWGQQLRVPDLKTFVALPTDFSNYETAPLGLEELAIYFNLCRELINAGWGWCRDQLSDPAPSPNHDDHIRLVAFLAQVNAEWLESPFEDGSPPSFIIEANRRRIGRSPGVPILGMVGVEPHTGMFDCDCPICQMLAERTEHHSDDTFSEIPGGAAFGSFAFIGIDGHHLELEDEFAFSACETREDWQLHRIPLDDDFDDFDDFKTDASEPNFSAGPTAKTEEPDPFAPVWSSQVCDEPLPGDPLDHMKLAFLVAEMIGVLHSLQAPHPRIEQLNGCFTNFRHSEPDPKTACERLCGYLEDLARQYPELVSRVADLQSRLPKVTRDSPADQ